MLTYGCIVGAGVSTAAAIPDFRSASGLFSGKSKGGHSVKDLFHVRCLAVSPIHHRIVYPVMEADPPIAPNASRKTSRTHNFSFVSIHSRAAHPLSYLLVFP